MKKLDKKELTLGAAKISCADLVGREIIIIGYVGAEGAKRIAKAEEDVILARFSPIIYNGVMGDNPQCSILDYRNELLEASAIALIEAGIGGIEGALFDLANTFSVGMDIDLKELPIKQETIEVCNLLDVNPYKLYSKGAYVLFAEDGDKCIVLAENLGLNAKIVGQVTKGLDKVFICNDERSFITPSRGRDEIYRFISKGDLI